MREDVHVPRVLINVPGGEAWVGCVVMGPRRARPIYIRRMREWREWYLVRVLVDGESKPRDVCATRVSE